MWGNLYEKIPLRVAEKNLFISVAFNTIGGFILRPSVFLKQEKGGSHGIQISGKVQHPYQLEETGGQKIWAGDVVLCMNTVCHILMARVYCAMCQ